MLCFNSTSFHIRIIIILPSFDRPVHRKGPEGKTLAAESFLKVTGASLQPFAGNGGFSIYSDARSSSVRERFILSYCSMTPLNACDGLACVHLDF